VTALPGPACGTAALEVILPPSREPEAESGMASPEEAAAPFRHGVFRVSKQPAFWRMAAGVAFRRRRLTPPRIRDSPPKEFRNE
jgi:hypothetical protein